MSDTAKVRIIEAAGPIFAGKGFNGTTVREICAAAKVNQAAINYYFGSKESLYKEVFAATYSSFTPWSHAEEELSRDSSLPFESRFRDLLERRTREIFATELSHWKVQLLFREINDPTESCGAKLQEFIVRDYRALYHLLDEFFDASTPEDIRWKFLLNALGSIIHYRSSRWLLRKLLPDAIRDRFFQPEQVAAFTVDCFLAAAEPYRRKS